MPLGTLHGSMTLAGTLEYCVLMERLHDCRSGALESTRSSNTNGIRRSPDESALDLTAPPKLSRALLTVVHSRTAGTPERSWRLSCGDETAACECGCLFFLCKTQPDRTLLASLHPSAPYQFLLYVMCHEVCRHVKPKKEYSTPGFFLTDDASLPSRSSPTSAR